MNSQTKEPNKLKGRELTASNAGGLCAYTVVHGNVLTLQWWRWFDGRFQLGGECWVVRWFVDDGLPTTRGPSHILLVLWMGHPQVHRLMGPVQAHPPCPPLLILILPPLLLRNLILTLLIRQFQLMGNDGTLLKLSSSPIRAEFSSSRRRAPLFPQADVTS
jgi:hypothetical protein